MDQDGVTVVSETYLISLSEGCESDVTLVQDVEMESDISGCDSSEVELDSSTENHSTDDSDWSNCQEVSENVESSVDLESNKISLKKQVDHPSDLIKFFGLRNPLRKSYATFAQNRRNKRLYLPVPSKLKCNKCYFRTQSHFALKMHIEQNHSDKTWYLCMSCDHTTDTELSMRDHVETSIMLQSLHLLDNDVNDNLSLSNELIKMSDKKRNRYKNNLKKRLIHNGGYICIRGRRNSDNTVLLLCSSSSNKPIIKIINR